MSKEFTGRILECDDSRIIEVMKRYALQAVLYHLTGNASCENRNCRLFNAHWQEEVIHAQVENGILCEYHTEIANSMGTDNEA